MQVALELFSFKNRLPSQLSSGRDLHSFTGVWHLAQPSCRVSTMYELFKFEHTASHSQMASRKNILY